MINVETAEKIILDHLYVPSQEKVDISEAVGRVLDSDIYSDRPFPPFDRVTMDGIAIRFDEFNNGRIDFVIDGIAAAGSAQLTLSDPQKCIEIMTGAILPEGTDTVIRYEDTEKNDSVIRIITSNVKQGQNIHQKGSDFDETRPVLSKNKKIRPMDVGVLATVGYSTVPVLSLPKILIISSGDELVDIDIKPKTYQIRKSNSYVIESRLREWNISCDRVHLRDDLEMNKNLLREYADKYDVFIISGGVSMGKFDFIPTALQQIGVEEKFHKVSQRPGKPFWFGAKEGLKVFALPGNPVSAYTCFCRYFLRWLEASYFQESKPIYVELSEDILFGPDLTYFAQVRIQQQNDTTLTAFYSPGNGSGDLINPTLVDGFVELPKGKEVYKKGETYRYFTY